jgi:MFS family permease
LPRYFIDVAPFRESSAFRRLWVGYVVNQIGSQVTVVAIAYQTYRITGSSVDVGLISLVQIVPVIMAPLLAGAVADFFDRRVLLLLTNAGGGLCSIGLGVTSVLHIRAVWPLFLLAAATAIFSGADNPIRTAVMISLVERRLLTAVNVLRSLLAQVASIIGPALAGLLLGLGVGVVYWLDAATFALAIAAVRGLPSGLRVGESAAFGIRSVVDGLKFVRSSPPILGCLAADLGATVLGMPESLFPAIALDQFHGRPATLGLLYAAPGCGALVTGAFSGWTSRVRRYGLAVIAAIIGWGVAFAAFGLARQLWIVLSLLAIAGGANAISAVFRNTIVQTEASAQMFGRVASIQTVVVQVGPRLGNAEAGVAANFIGATSAVAVGGIASVAAILVIAALMPQFRRYTPDAETHAAGDPESTGLAEGPDGAAA